VYKRQLFIDASNNRVGVANVSPATALDVSGTITGTLFSGSGASLTNIPNVALDNSSITINSYSTALGGTVTLSTSDIGEGTNLYYTDARARSSISITDSGGDGSLAYDNGTGVITYTGPSAAEVRAHISAGTGVDFSSGVISIGQSVGTSDTVTFNNLTVSTTATIPYDNTISGLTATNIQSAITELNTLVGGGNIGSQANYEIYEFTATGNQTTFDISTQGSPAPSYDPGYIQVFMNGVLLSETDYTAVDGSNVVLSTGATAGQLISIITLDSFNIQELLRVTSIDASASTDSIVIDASNNVTINKSNFSSLPAVSKLNIFGDGVTLRLDGSSATTKSILFRNTSVANPGEMYADGSLRLRTEDANTRITFHTNSSGSDNERMRIDSSGNVGIGTDTPVGNLHIVGGDGVNGSSTIGDASNEFIIENNSDAGLTIRSGANQNGVISFADPDDHNVGQVYYSHDTDKMSIVTNDEMQMTIDSAGTVDVVNDILTNNAKLKAIAESNTDTAVDVFVYDTRKDSDGGAWRKRTQHTSWYNETLNTSTRGSRKEFPCVAVIVIASNNVIIYDGDDPDMPMWMVFPADAYITWASDSDTGTSCVSALNSKLFIGNSNGYGDCIVDFVSDDTRLVYNNNNYALTKRTVVDRNILESTEFPLYYAGGDGYNIVNNAINDVAMTVLPNAPIDADTGLPVPTIAVATEGGVSVIKDDGTIVDSSLTVAINSVGFTQNHSLIYNRTDFSSDIGDRTYVQLSIPTSDGFTADQEYSEHSVPRLNRVNNPDLVGMDDDNYAIGSGTYNYGFAHLYNNTTNKADSLFTHITSNYNTGWMNGDIKLATLSDTDDTDVTGSELVTNGTFDTDLSGWTDISIGTGSVSWNASGYVDLTSVDSSNSGWITQSFDTVIGKTYVASITRIVNNSILQIGISPGNNSIYQSGNISSTDETVTFVATVSTTYVSILNFNYTGTSQVDNISVRLAEPDRSVNGNGLQVFGTITKTAVATGADLVGYSGFTSGQFTGNRLEQPYNSDLAFGTGDFSINFWIKNIEDGYDIMGIGKRNSNFAWTLYKDAQGGLRYTFSTNGTSTADQIEYQFGDNNTIPNWTSVNILRRSGVFHIYINGKLEETLTGNETASLYDPQEPLVIGSGNTNNNTDSDVSIALLRISATAPTPEQIAKIYNDEKHLFSENAKATLYGSSDAVTALAYDDDTELLHVGTSAGRSEFQGLRRVNNTTDAVSEAISASNGFIVED